MFERTERWGLLFSHDTEGETRDHSAASGWIEQPLGGKASAQRGQGKTVDLTVNHCK